LPYQSSMGYPVWWSSCRWVMAVIEWAQSAYQGQLWARLVCSLACALACSSALACSCCCPSSKYSPRDAAWSNGRAQGGQRRSSAPRAWPGRRWRSSAPRAWPGRRWRSSAPRAWPGRRWRSSAPRAWPGRRWRSSAPRAWPGRRGRDDYDARVGRHRRWRCRDVDVGHRSLVRARRWRGRDVDVGHRSLVRARRWRCRDVDVGHRSFVSPRGCAWCWSRSHGDGRRGWRRLESCHRRESSKPFRSGSHETTALLRVGAGRGARA